MNKSIFESCPTVSTIGTRQLIAFPSQIAKLYELLEHSCETGAATVDAETPGNEHCMPWQRAPWADQKGSIVKHPHKSSSLR